MKSAFDRVRALIVASLVFVLILTGCSQTERRKTEIFGMVTKNRETLVQDVSDWDFEDSRGIRECLLSVCGL